LDKERGTGVGEHRNEGTEPTLCCIRGKVFESVIKSHPACTHQQLTVNTSHKNIDSTQHF